MFRGKMIRKLLGFIAGILLIFSGCDRYPTNPSTADGTSPAVEIRLVETEYLPVRATEDGLVADKINILTFEIESRIAAKAFEFCGRAQVEGPPESQSHVLHFRTDTVNAVTTLPVVFNVIEIIQPGDIIRLVRSKYPTNEYAPFIGNQGMIESIEITEIWAIDMTGNRTRISFSESTS